MNNQIANHHDLSPDTVKGMCITFVVIDYMKRWFDQLQ